MGKLEDHQKVEQVKAILHELQTIQFDTVNSASSSSDYQDFENSIVVSGSSDTYGQLIKHNNNLPSDQKTAIFPIVIVICFSITALSLAIYALMIKDQLPWQTKAPVQITSPQFGTPQIDTPIANPGDISARSADNRSGFLSEGQKIVKQANKLVQSGKVIEARLLLLNALEANPTNADLTLSLAHSYDPNILKVVPSANAEPDLQEADRWYKQWRELVRN